MITNIVTGIVLVKFMLALNMTVAVGTLNGILFCAHIVAANADIYNVLLSVSVSQYCHCNNYSYRGLILILA